VDKTVVRLRVAEAGKASELTALLAAGVVGDPEQGAVTEADAAAVEPARQPLLDMADQLDERSQPPVVLRLLRQVRKPARQHPADQTEELPGRADPNRRLRDRQRDQLSIADQRLPTAARRDPILVGENVGCNDKGFQIRHLELRSRGDTGLEALLREQPAGPCREPAVSHQPSSRRLSAENTQSEWAGALISQTSDTCDTCSLVRSRCGPRPKQSAHLQDASSPVPPTRGRPVNAGLLFDEEETRLGWWPQNGRRRERASPHRLAPFRYLHSCRAVPGREDGAGQARAQNP